MVLDADEPLAAGWYGCLCGAELLDGEVRAADLPHLAGLDQLVERGRPKQDKVGKGALFDLVDGKAGAEHAHADLVARRLLEGRNEAFHDLLDRAAVLVALGKAAEQHLAVSVDDGEQIIEIVRDAARQHSDGLHLLRLTEVLFELLAVCTILRNHQGSLLAGVADVVNQHVHFHGFPAFHQVADVADSRPFGPFSLKGFLDLLPILGGHQIREPQLEKFIAVVPVLLNCGAVDFQELERAGIHHQHRLGAFIEQKLGGSSAFLWLFVLGLLFSSNHFTASTGISSRVPRSRPRA